MFNVLVVYRFLAQRLCCVVKMYSGSVHASPPLSDAVGDSLMVVSRNNDVNLGQSLLVSMENTHEANMNNISARYKLVYVLKINNIKRFLSGFPLMLTC